MKYLLLFLLIGGNLYTQIDSTIFGLARKSNPNSIYFAKINPSTGVVSNISGASLATCINVTGSASTIDPTKGEFYFRDCSNQLVTVNMLNGNTINSPVITNATASSFGYMNYNCLDSVIYGLASRSNPNEIYFSKINPITGIVTLISPVSIGTSINATGATMNPIKKEYYFINSINQFVTVDIQTGNIINSPVISNSNGNGFNLFKYNCQDSTIYGLSVKNSPNQVFLSKINPITGVVTNISTTSLASVINITGSTIDPIKKQFYFENSTQFIAVDLIAGNLVSNPIVTNSNGLTFDLFKYNNGCCCSSASYINLGLDQTLCENDTLILNPSLVGTNLTWQDNSTNSSYTVTQQGSYWVKTSGSCSSIDTVNVFYNPLPNINLGNDTNLCQGNYLVLNANNLNSSFLWQDNSSNSSFTVTQQGNFWVDVTTNGCSTTDSITVNYIPLPIINLGNDTTLCAGNSLLLNASNANASYNWQNNTMNPTFNVSQQGSYWVDVTANGCSSSDSINVNYSALPIINLGNNISLCKGESIILNATNTNAAYLWQDNSSNSTYNVNEQGIYWVTVTVNNCNNTDSIFVDIITCDVNLEMPNVFTPNNDQANDLFIPKNVIGVENANLSIFNRWGMLLFQTTDMAVGWNGKINGNESPTGTYFWILSYTTIKNESKTLNGFLTLTR
jgi:gliding motility-associated-like protein